MGILSRFRRVGAGAERIPLTQSYDDSTCLIEALVDYGNYDTSAVVRPQVNKVLSALRQGFGTEVECPACNISFDIDEEGEMLPKDYGRCDKPYFGSLEPSRSVLDLTQLVNIQHEL
jgi:hypothetical protein